MVYSEIAIVVISFIAIWEFCKNKSGSTKCSHVNVDRSRMKPRPKIDPKGNSMAKRKSRDLSSRKPSLRKSSLKPTTPKSIDEPNTSNNFSTAVQS